MSINVTVTGNPVNIKKKMVSADPNYCKKEFEKLRLMRLEQVRQQSKDIAETVRNKVRKEKCKQMSKIENEGKEKLKKWQTRRLLELHSQYQEALVDIGLGHRQAVSQIEEDENQLEQKENNEELAKERGLQATKKLRRDKTEKQLKKTLPLKKKKISKDIESTRSNLVSKIHKIKSVRSPIKHKRKKLSANINISNVITTDSDTDEYVPELTNLRSSEAAEDTTISDLCHCSEEEEEEEKQEESKRIRAGKITQDKQTSTMVDAPVTNDKSAQTYIRELIQVSPPPRETRISDRIKRRTITNNAPDFCELFESGSSRYQAEDAENIPQNIKPCHCNGSKLEEKQTEDRPTVIRSQNRHSIPPNNSESHKSRKKSPEIPVKPKVTLRSAKDGSRSIQHISKSTIPTADKEVHYYNHPNRYSKSYIPSSESHVEKIDDDNLIVSPDVASEAEFYEKMHQRDQDAKIRGQRALEKEKIHREHRELLNKLPMLQKQERISEISNDKAKYHMSDDRLREQERIKQNHLDNAYEKLFPPQRKPAVVTLASKPYQGSNKGTHSADLTNNNGTSAPNSVSWDIEYKSPKLFTSEEVKQIIDQLNKQKVDRTPSDRSEQLKELLESLKAKKDMLLQEIITLPKEDSLTQLGSNFRKSQTSSEPQSRETVKRRRSVAQKSSSSSSNEANSAGENKVQCKCAMTNTMKPSPRKKAKLKSRQKILILQNTSTQTTPKISNSSDSNNSNGEKLIRVEEKCTCISPSLIQAEKRDSSSRKVVHKSCQCYEASTVEEEPIEIVIKTISDHKPEVILTSSDKNIKVIREEERKTMPVVKEPSSKTVPAVKETGKGLPSVKEPGKARPAVVKQPSKSKQEKVQVTSPRSKPTKRPAWHDHLSRNSDFSTTTTSYLSTPDVSSKTKKSPQHEKQATNIFANIKKLLNKTRGSIDDLAVSAVSEVSTPSQSIIEMESNNPLAPIMQYIRQHLGDIQYLEKSNISSSSSSSSDSKNDSVKFKIQQPQDSVVEEQSTLSPSKPEEAKNNTNQRYILKQYSEIAESCNKRISDLNVMIEKVREEKMRMLQSPPESIITDDYSTGYMDLPPKLNEEKESTSSSSTISLEQEELNRLLLDIDYSYAERLKKLTPAELSEQKRLDNIPSSSSINSDEELLARFRRLLETPLTETDDTQPREIVGKSQFEPKTDDFVPLLDIAKLPKLTTTTTGLDQDLNSISRKRPPPSKALEVARRFNGNISAKPHELSTIVEADSLLSGKLDVSQKTGQAKAIWIEPKPQQSEARKVSPVLKEKSSSSSSSIESSKSNNSSDISLPDILTELIGSGNGKTCNNGKSPTIIELSGNIVQSSSSSSGDKSGMEAMEQMLCSIGMEWAIPTLRKTREARLLTSSSSSLDLSAAKKICDPCKISSSTFKSDLSPGGFFSDQDISAIDVGNNSSNKTTHQRTSTPVDDCQTSSKNKSKKRVCFSDDSDVSSVNNKNKSDNEPKFYSLTEHTNSQNM